METLTISSILGLSKNHPKGFSSSRININPGIKGEVILSPDHPQLLSLRDSTQCIPCICADFSINILGSEIIATRWYLTSVNHAAEFRLPPFYLEISEFELTEMAVTPISTNNTAENTHAIISYTNSDIVTLVGLLLHVYPIFQLDQFTYLILLQIEDERVYVFFTGDDLLALHSLLKPNREYRITNLLQKSVPGDDSKIKTFLSTQETNILTVFSGTASLDPLSQIHENHSTIEGFVTEFVELESGHFLLNSSTHLFLCHTPSFLPVWGLKIGAKIRVSEVRMCSTELDGKITEYAWCCHHTRIELLETSKRPRSFYPYLPRMFSSLILYVELSASSALHLTVILGKFTKTFEILHAVVHPLIDLFKLKYLPPSDPILDLKRIVFTNECIVTPFHELKLPTPFTLTDLTDWLALSSSHDEFISELDSTPKFDFKSPPSWDRIKHSSTHVENMMKGTLLGRVTLCPDSGHVVLSDTQTKIPIHFTTGIYPDELINVVDSLVAIKDYDLTVERSAFPNQVSTLTQAYICTRYQNLLTLLPSPSKPVKTGGYVIHVLSKSPLRIDTSPSKKIEFRFTIYAKIFLNCITSQSQCTTNPTDTLIGELPLVFVAGMVRWWRMLESGWLYYWNGFDGSQINPYIISRGNRMTFKHEWTLYPIGQLPTRPVLAPDNDIVTLLHSVKDGECKTCLIIGQVNVAKFQPDLFSKGEFVCRNGNWMVDLSHFKSISLSEIQKFNYSLLPFFYSLQLSLIFPVTDSLFLPIFINLPLSRMPIGLEVGSWVRLTGVKIKYTANNMLKGNIDRKGSVEVLTHPPSSKLPPSIYSKIKPLSCSNFRTFQAICIRVAKSLTQDEAIEETPLQKVSPVKGMYSNRFAFSKGQRTVELEKRRMQKFSILLRAYKVLRLILDLDKLISLTIQKSCYCCKQLQSDVPNNCPKSTFKMTANLFAYIDSDTVIVKTTNVCTKLLLNFTESQMVELSDMLQNRNVLEIDRNYFDSNEVQPPPLPWLPDLFFNFKTSRIDAIVTHYVITQELSTGKYPFQLTLYNFKFK